MLGNSCGLQPRMARTYLEEELDKWAKMYVLSKATATFTQIFLKKYHLLSAFCLLSTCKRPFSPQEFQKLQFLHSVSVDMKNTAFGCTMMS